MKMKSVRKAVKLLLPMGGYRVWMRMRYPQLQIKERIPSGLWWRLLGGLVPYGVYCILDQRGDQDVRPGKYWAPYGMMCRHVALEYGYAVVDGELLRGMGDSALGKTLENETKYSAGVRFVRRISPYGLVLWWDRTDPASAPVHTGKTSVVKSLDRVDASQFDVRALSRQIKQLDDRVRRMESQVETRFDNLEIQILKLRLAVKSLSEKN